MRSDSLLQSSIQFCVFPDPPETSIYPRNDVQLGVENSLICHVTGFFPPPVNISWTKNNVIVTEGVGLSRYRPRNDGTFHIFSSLDIVPEERDIYSCTVNHRALQGQAQTKIWGKCHSESEIKSCYSQLFFILIICTYKTTVIILRQITALTSVTFTPLTMINRCPRDGCCPTQSRSSGLLWSRVHSGAAGSSYGNLLLY